MQFINRDYLPVIEKKPLTIPRCNKAAAERRKRIEEMQDKKKFKEEKFPW